MFKSGLKYKLNAVNAHGIHSPFVFEFYNEVLKKTSRAKQPQIEKLRKELLSDATEIEITDFGAGSRKHDSNKRTISELAKNAAVSKKYGRLLNRIVDFYKLTSVLELGTSLGIGSAYLAKNDTIVLTLEGCPEIATRAQLNFDELQLNNIHLRVGEFETSFADIEEREFDLIYIDGNHTEEATGAYFEKFLAHSHNDSFLIFDDIRWSEGMEKAWQTIIRSDKIHVSIELLRMGIVLKRKEQVKQHFVLKF
ncbi:MAG: putative O-methyltransferase YrrM [Arenicella sp.]|jgi:predicted O-methyltransferase YrrM